MVGSKLVRPLEDDWRATLDAIARKHLWPSSREVERLGAAVAALSRAYNDPERSGALPRHAAAARLGFSFARDVPKGAAAVRELVAAGALAPSGPALSVLDLGAGLGAMTWGAVRALRAAGMRSDVHATWVDHDREALGLGLQIVRARRPAAAAGLQVRSLARPLDDLADLGRFDLVLLGNVLSELGGGLPEPARVARHTETVRALLERHLERRGAVVVVEPALRDRTRRLHRVRDALAAGGRPAFAPCLHSAPCPALARESDWCHEDLPVDLPEWLWPVARAAGLRCQGLTFSYLVVTEGGERLVDALGPAEGARLRVVSESRPSKGKCETFLCGEFGAVPAQAARARVVRLDRDATAANGAWNRVGRGDVLEVDPAPTIDRPRVGPGTAVRLTEAMPSRCAARTAAMAPPQEPG